MPSGLWLVLSIRTHGTSEDNNRKLGYSFEPVQVDPSGSSSTAAACPGCSSATNLQISPKSTGDHVA